MNADVDLTIVIPTYNAASILNECLSNLREIGTTSRVLIVDDHSTDNTPKMVRERFPEYQLLRTERNFGFAGTCNHGLRNTETRYVAFLNNDAFPESGWGIGMVKELERDPGAAIVCSKIYRRNIKQLDSVGGVIEFPMGDAPPRGYLEPDTGTYEDPTDVAYASGAAMVARTNLLRELGGFDEDYRNYFEETDLAWRLRLMGHRIRYLPRPTVQHVGSYTMGANPARKTFYIARNRCTTNLKNLEGRNIALWLSYEAVYAMLLPVGTVFFSGYRAYTAAYFRGLAAFAWHLPATLQKRRDTQAHRRLPDAQVLKLHRRVDLATVVRRYLGLIRTEGEHLYSPEILKAAEP